LTFFSLPFLSPDLSFFFFWTLFSPRPPTYYPPPPTVPLWPICLYI
jgi:hypothetical protein